MSQPQPARHAGKKAATVPFKSGFVAIAGQPNTGKSTFLNKVLGQKVAIVTPKAQTTRTRILGVCHRPNCQIVLLDTPGIHRPGASLFNKAMVRTAYETCREGEVILYFIDGTKGINDSDRTILERLQPGTDGSKKRPLLLVLNKVDRLAEPVLFARLQALQEIPSAAVIPLSAMSGYNVEHLLSLLPDYLPEGPRYFPEDQWTDQPEQFFAAEVIREKLFLNLQKELPYSLAVKLNKFQPRLPAGDKEIWDVEATILVERESQKAIVIGQKGSMLKQVGSAARLELERLFSVPIYLKLWVRVRKEWGEDMTLLQDLGYPGITVGSEASEEDVALG
ncbi:MAG: GTPase Era [Magnetococcales bacterium]|nr:GTPase Era [Magnetococcales bacterium]MBF0113974.1 GTPase Era [Magnetococcales bacterium]